MHKPAAMARQENASLSTIGKGAALHFLVRPISSDLLVPISIDPYIQRYGGRWDRIGKTDFEKAIQKKNGSGSNWDGRRPNNVSARHQREWCRSGAVRRISNRCHNGREAGSGAPTLRSYIVDANWRTYYFKVQ